MNDPATNLLAQIPHGQPGHTVLREALLVAIHNAYHLGQLVVVRRALARGRMSKLSRGGARSDDRRTLGIERIEFLALILKPLNNEGFDYSDGCCAEGFEVDSMIGLSDLRLKSARLERPEEWRKGLRCVLH